jgi:hypothetical protein
MLTSAILTKEGIDIDIVQVTIEANIYAPPAPPWYSRR